MRVISVNVGLPRTVQWKGKAVSTGILTGKRLNAAASFEAKARRI